jgi:hypothetical protein
MTELKTAIQFYKEIRKEEDKYKLVNGLFIVKYLDDEISILLGEFLKAGKVLNFSKTNKIRFYTTNQKFNKKKNLGTNARGDSWKELNIKFKEKPIREILK